MKYLHLNPNFRPFGQSIEFKSFIFSGGEPHIKIIDNIDCEDTVMVTQRINSFNDLGLALIATNALRNIGVRKIQLFIPYFPGARQDRLMVKGEPLTVKVYADIINQQLYDKVIIFDPHSDVAPALINNVEVKNNFDFVKECTESFNDFLLVSPDAGALKKVYKISSFLGAVPVVECSKIRDVSNGKLTGFKVNEENLKEKPCVIVDDICDGGGTFIGLAEELKKKNAGNIFLMVSHGIFSKGFEELDKHFEQIYTTNSFKDLDETFINDYKYYKGHAPKIIQYKL